MSAGKVLAGLLMGLGGGAGGGTWWEKRRQARRAFAEWSTNENAFWAMHDSAAEALRTQQWRLAAGWVAVAGDLLGQARVLRDAAWPTYPVDAARVEKMRAAVRTLAEHLANRSAPPELATQVPATPPRAGLGGLAP